MLFVSVVATLSLFSVAAMPKQDVAVELFYDGAWQDITANDDVFTDTPITIRRGQGDESAAFRPASISMRLANDDDMYRTSNPESPLYGKAGRNTPTRVSVGGAVRGIVESSSWAPDQTQDFRASPRRGKAWVDLQGGGLLQRIGQWTQMLRSPFHRVNSALSDLTGYWPMENEPQEATLTPEIAGSRTGTVRYVTAPSNDSPMGSEPLVKIGSQGFMEGYFATTGSTTNGWQLSWVMRLPIQPDGSTAIAPMEWELVDGSTGSLQWVGTSLWLFTFDASGGSQAEIVLDGSATDFTKWNMFRYKVSVSGGTATGEFSWYEDGGNIIGGSDTYSATTTSELKRWFVGIASGGENSETAYGHVLGTASTVSDLESDDRIQSFRGWVSEPASFRFSRLCSEFGILHYVSNSFDDSSPMGPQRPDSLPNLIREIVATEDAMLYDHLTELRLYFLSRYDRYNKTPALTLIPEDLPTLPREVTDDLDVHNVVTASQRDGGDYTATDDTGPLGTQDPPDGVGEYRQTVNVNVDDETTNLPQVANWWLRRGTVNLPRYPQLTIDLNAKPDLVSDVEAVDIGDVIEITGFRENTIRLHVLGYTETIGTHSRRIVFTCAPDQQFVTGVYDDVARYDSASTTLKTAVSSAATSLTFTTTDGNDLWSTTAEPYDVFIAGERITVTSMGSASGSGPYDQTATVTRAVNGISKALAAGEEIHIATPGRWAL